jgi:signal recognition particle subunit SRP72
MCLASQDLADSEKKTELLPIQVQRLYVITALGKLDEAEALAEEIAVDE